MAKYFANLLAAMAGADRTIEDKLDLILKGVTNMDVNEQLILTALGKLETAMTDDLAAVSADLKALAAASPGGISLADATALAARIDAVTSNVMTQTAAAKAAIPAPPPAV